MKLKVWGTNCWFNDSGRQCRAVVATKTKKAAIAAFNQSRYMFDWYSCETGNNKEIELALSKPGLVIEIEQY